MLRGTKQIVIVTIVTHPAIFPTCFAASAATNLSLLAVYLSIHLLVKYSKIKEFSYIGMISAT
jgi:hypothetical protein